MNMNKSINMSVNKSVNENMGKDIDKSNNKNMNNGDVINRLDVVRKYTPHLNNVDAKSPLTVAMAGFVSRQMITGRQTL